MNRSIVVINHGLGNIASIKNAISFLGYSYREQSVGPIDSPKDTLYVLPGVGAFSTAMKYLRDHDLLGLSNPNVSILGICLGMQLLFKSGSEGGDTIGLCRLHGQVDSLKKHPNFSENILLPNVGWRYVNACSSSPYISCLDNISMQCYFLHSYYAQDVHPNHIKAVSDYAGCTIPSVVCSHNLIGFQFHPEKSGLKGLKLLDQGISCLINK